MAKPLVCGSHQAGGAELFLILGLAVPGIFRQGQEAGLRPQVSQHDVSHPVTRHARQQYHHHAAIHRQREAPSTDLLPFKVQSLKRAPPHWLCCHVDTCAAAVSQV